MQHKMHEHAEGEKMAAAARALQEAVEAALEPSTDPYPDHNPNQVQAVGRAASAVAALAGRAVLLEAKAHCKADSTFYKLAKVQLLAAPAHEGAPAEAGDAEAGALPLSQLLYSARWLMTGPLNERQCHGDRPMVHNKRQRFELVHL